MKYYLYDTNGYSEYHEIIEFDTVSDVVNYLESHLGKIGPSGNRYDLGNYRLIEGKELKLKIVEMVSKVEVGR